MTPSRIDTPTAWQQVFDQLQGLPELRQLAEDPRRQEACRVNACGLQLDWRFQRITGSVHAALLNMARDLGLPGKIARMAQGELINHTEQRPALHIALRTSTTDAQWSPPWPADIQAQVLEERERMLTFAGQLVAGQHLGTRGYAITDVVNLGIGGSHLGPRLVAESLGTQERLPRVHFLSSPDAAQTLNLLGRLRPQSTLFVIASKTFTTQETMALADAAKGWLMSVGRLGRDDVGHHLAAVTARPDLALAYGVPAGQTFPFWDWVGGRYSLWSSIGLAAAVAIGPEGFRALLNGAHDMDRHFLEAPLEENLPIIQALHGIWNRNVLGASSLVIAPYDDRLRRFTAHLQQLDMESNGKRVTTDGSECPLPTGPKVWGGLGMDGQHAYFQLLHQGMHLVPVDFICVRPGPRGVRPAWLQAERLEQIVARNQSAQAQAMAMGRNEEETRRALLDEGLSPREVDRLTPHRTYPGGRPSSTLWMDRFDAYHLGALLALAEHRVVSQAMLWDINPFDQWGVELGKTLVKRMGA